MQKLLLKITNLPPSSDAKLIDVGRGYEFRWDNAHNGYTFHPTAQEDIEAIYNGIAAVRANWVIIPVLISGDATAAPAASAAPAVTPDEREEHVAYVSKLHADIDSASATITKLRLQLTADDETIAMLRADLSAQQAKAAPKPAAKGAKPKPAPANETSNDDDLPV